MTEMDAFEHQVAHEILLDVGPERQIDAMGVVKSVKELDSAGGFTMFSALKFVIAGAVVALFGGFLLTAMLAGPGGNEVVPGAVSGSPSPGPTAADTPSSDARATEPMGFFSSLVTQEVEPGVLRLVNDGHLDLTQAMVPEHGISRTVIAPDGYAWMFGAEAFFRLGSGGEVYYWPAGSPSSADFAPNGDIWAAYPGVIRVFHLGDWSTRRIDLRAEDIRIAPDGRAWVHVSEEGTEDAIGWLAPEDLTFTLARQSSGADDSKVELADGGALSMPGDGTMEIYRWATREWETVPAPAGFGSVLIGTGGTVWAITCPDSFCWGPWGDRSQATFARLDGRTWQEWAPPQAGLAAGGSELVAPDGAIWGPAATIRDDVCGGIVRFDGVVSTRWLDGHCIEEIAIGRDGSAWVQAFERSPLAASDKPDDGPVETYVITPEAVAAAE